MPFCASCGAAVEGRFCAKCGTPLGAAAPPAGAAPVGAGGPAPIAAAGLTENAAAALCYVLTFITGILFLVLEPYNKNRNIRFHAFQAIFLGVAWIAIWIAVGIIFAMMGSLGFFFGYLALRSLIGLAFFILWIYLIVMAYQGKTVVLPIIGPLAQKQA
jgi:uncharacterized membrane protein